MRLPALILKNLLRRKTRSAFAILGISIGIATIIALGAVTDGLKFSMDQILKTGKPDFVIAEKGVADMMFRRIDEGKIGEIEKVEGVGRATGVLFLAYPIGDRPFFIVFGVKSQDLPMVGAEITDGVTLNEESEDKIILADEPTGNLDSASGDEVVHILQKLNADGRTIILVMHDEEIATHANIVYHIRNGKILE